MKHCLQALSWLKAFEFGFQGFGEVGKWNRWAPNQERAHSVGPAVFGKLPVGERKAIKYNAAWLSQVTQAAPDHTFRVQVENEF